MYLFYKYVFHFALLVVTLFIILQLFALERNTLMPTLMGDAIMLLAHYVSVNDDVELLHCTSKYVLSLSEEFRLGPNLRHSI